MTLDKLEFQASDGAFNEMLSGEMLAQGVSKADTVEFPNMELNLRTLKLSF